VGSGNPVVPAFDVDAWAIAPEIIIENNGRIVGAGGRGGNSETSPSNPLAAGQDGGRALFTRTPITLYNNGEIWGGGGGGGGGTGLNTPQPALGSGGGGGGTVPGSAGFSATDMGGPGGPTSGGLGGVPVIGVPGGSGGPPGFAGVDGGSYLGGPQAPAGAAGAAIDGVSFCTITLAGDRRGTEIN
jgi:hypothetical protein